MWAVLALGALATSPALARQPNLIVIMADDLGAKELGCYGHPEHRTPRLDALAKTGTQFRTCYATPVCHPTRFEIMTGQYGSHNGVFNFANRPGGPKGNAKVEDIGANHITFAEVLKPAGYATGLAGKWQLSGEAPTLVNDCGFDEYMIWAYKNNWPPGTDYTGGYEGRGNSKPARYWHPSLVTNGKYQPTKPDDYGPDLHTDFLIDFMKRHRDEPFFVYYPMCLTHAPWLPTPDSEQNGKKRGSGGPQNFQANVEYMDKLVGRIVDALDELGLRENTILFFTGDNGTGNDGKNKPTELGARVPMIVNGPGVQARGAIDDLVDLSDVLPTLADLAGTTPPSDRPIDGKSFAGVLKGQPSPRDWIFSYLGGDRIVRDKRWLLEANSMTRPGRFYDCGESRDGTGYRDVTTSDDPEVRAARERFEKILADLPSPVVD